MAKEEVKIIDENDFMERQQKFEKKLIKLQEEFNIGIYAANVMLQNQEVQPMIKMVDTKK